MLENDVDNKTSFSFQTLKTCFSNLLKSYVYKPTAGWKYLKLLTMKVATLALRCFARFCKFLSFDRGEHATLMLIAHLNSSE